MTSLPVHLHPINVVVYNDPEKSNLVALTLVREDRVGLTSGLPVVPPGALPGI